MKNAVLRWIARRLITIQKWRLLFKIIICLIVPFLGIFWGVYDLVTGERTEGIELIVVSILGEILISGGLVYVIYAFIY